VAENETAKVGDPELLMEGLDTRVGEGGSRLFLCIRLVERNGWNED